MPSLSSLGLTVNPSKEPLAYPGVSVKESCLIVGSWLYQLRHRPGLPIADWELAVDGGPLRHTPVAGPRRHPLDEALRLARSPSMAVRFPVVAIGSNASPGQLAHKFTSGTFVSEIVPMTLARVRGIAVGHSAHVSKAGYVPYVPLARELSVERALFILWLDETQLVRVNETEPSYHPVTVGRENAPAVLESGERVEVFSMYRGRWGALRLAADAQPLEATNQEEVLSLLGSLPWFYDLVPEIQEGAAVAVRALAADERRRVEIRERLAAAGLVGTDGLELRGFAPVPYPEAVAASPS